jgi:hypothetical protein
MSLTLHVAAVPLLDVGLQAGTRSKPSSSTPLIKAKPAEQQQAGKAIPAMFKLEPSEEQRRYGMVKSQLLDALAPTPDTIQAVGSDPVLASGARLSKPLNGLNPFLRCPQAGLLCCILPIPHDAVLAAASMADGRASCRGGTRYTAMLAGRGQSRLTVEPHHAAAHMHFSSRAALLQLVRGLACTAALVQPLF